jgi:hypothetical protein
MTTVKLQTEADILHAMENRICIYVDLQVESQVSGEIDGLVWDTALNGLWLQLMTCVESKVKHEHQ